MKLNTCSDAHFTFHSVTVAMTEWRTKYRRKMNEADNKQRQRAVDSLLNFETVKYFANERHEADQLKEAVQDYQEEEWKTLASLNLLNVVQVKQEGYMYKDILRKKSNVKR